MIDRYAFVAITATDLPAARRFWVEQLGFPVTEEQPDRFFILDAGGLRLCVDSADDEAHRAGGRDPVIGLRVASVDAVLEQLAGRGLRPDHGPLQGSRGRFAELRDPDGRVVVLTEFD